MKAEEIVSIDSEAGIIASLIHHPEFAFYSEYLLPKRLIFGSLRSSLLASPVVGVIIGGSHIEVLQQEIAH